MFAPGHKSIFRVNRKIEKNGMSKIFPAQTNEDFETAKKLFVEFKQTSPYRYNPIEDAVFMELKLA